jgi:hypothetical protein
MTKKNIVHIRFELSRFRHGAFLMSIEKNKRLNRSARWVPCKEEVRCYNIMILSKNELRSSSGRLRYRVRVRAGIDYGVTAVSIMSCSCPTTVSYICRCSTIRVPPVLSIPLVVPFVSPRLTILLFAALFACSLSAVLGPVRVFAVRCSHARDGADTSRLLYAALHFRVRPRPLRRRRSCSTRKRMSSTFAIICQS